MDENWFITMTGDKARMNGVAAKQLTPSQKFRVKKFAGKILASTFWDQDVIPIIAYLPKDKLSTRSITNLCRGN
jgi:hypothetical protein